ncbi:MAG: hypothetical protein HYX52_04750 [Chloroflexi bacterium]|nr:hypothetical protein [Chloroflexota bacterium]
MTARLCLKARPTPAQLADRLRPLPDGSMPEGLELYLDVGDIADQAAMEAAVRRLEAAPVPEGFAWLIEGPVGSLDGAFFDVTRSAEADALVVERLAWMAQRIGAKAVNIHVIAPSDDLDRLTSACHDTLLRRCVPFLQHFTDTIIAAGAVPTVENMPPVLRMREGGYFFTPIGMAAADLLWLAQEIPGLAILPDTSHAGLYLNARALAEGRGTGLGEAWGDGHVWREPLLRFLRHGLPSEPDSLLGYVRQFGGRCANAQVSNAAGILGEGLPYAEGDFNLAPAIAWLGEHARHIVTETLEANQDDARWMRDAYQRMRAVLAR